MIRSLWTIIVTIAIANMLGFTIFLAWLSVTDRLSADRVNDLRELFSETVAMQEAADEQAEKEASAQAAIDADRAAIGTPPITAQGKSKYIDEIAQSAEQRAIRTAREAQDRQETLFQWQRDLDKREAKFRAEKERFEAVRAEIKEREGSEQFKKTLKIYESLPPDQAASILTQLVQQGDEDQVVSFLNAMKPRIAGDITGTIEADDPALAARLLERLREHGVEPDVASEEP